MTISSKHFSEHGDLGRQVVFFDDPVWPHAAQELVLAEDRAASLDEGHQRIERPPAQLDPAPIGQKLATMAHDLESAKFNGYGIFGRATHSPDCSATLHNFSERITLRQRLVRRLLVALAHEQGPRLEEASAR
jgi:hypothetical protein